MAVDREKVLIIKPGYSETLDPEMSGYVSLGDIVRTTPILHLFPKDQYHVTWLVDGYGRSLLRGHEMIDRVLTINEFTPFHLMNEHFDIVVNLERDPGICAIADTIPAWRRFGFRLDRRQGVIASYDYAHHALKMVEDPIFKRSQTRSWTDRLFEMMGEPYHGQSYVLGFKGDNVKPEYDIGLNYRIGAKFPLKNWPMANWEELNERLSQTLSVSWQPEQDDVRNIEDYFEWIAKCRVIISCDSLGLHLALAFSRSVVGMFGPTHSQEIDDFDGLVKLTPDMPEPCSGCKSNKCWQDEPCMNLISVDRVEAAALEFLK